MIIVSGDWHGKFEIIIQLLKEKEITDCFLIQVGDFGVGFKNKKKSIAELKLLNKFLKSKNIFLYAIRGNHDDPEYFTGKDKSLIFSNIVLVPDYSIIKIEDKTFFFLGGAISIDRKPNPDIIDRYGRPWNGRTQGVNYWDKEFIVFNEEVLRSIVGIDVVITHSSPAFVHPMDSSGLVKWYKHDNDLEEDIHKERSLLSDVYFILKQSSNIQHWCYGHYHDSNVEDFDNTRFRLLDVYEFYELR